MKKLLIIKTGTTFSSIYERYGDFEDFIINQIGIPMDEVVIAPIYKTKTLPDLKDIAAIIITGSHAMVTDKEDWNLYLGNWLRGLRPGEIPILGICYGHQLIADAFGGKVGYHSCGKEVGTVRIELTDDGKTDPLLECLPTDFWGHVTHAQTVIELPKGARLLAKNSFEPHHAFVINENIWGVQFHPEFNVDIIQAYVEEQSTTLIKEGHELDRIYESIQENVYGKNILQRFIKIAEEYK